MDEHKARIAHCLSLARNAPVLPTNFRVGAMLVDASTGTVLSEGYTNELPGNTHAEQVCLLKVSEEKGHDAPAPAPAPALSSASNEVLLYTTVEPCIKRLSGNESCTERILEARKSGARITKVYVGVTEPDTFVKKNQGRALLEDAGIEVVHVHGLEDDILKVAMAGHQSIPTQT